MNRYICGMTLNEITDFIGLHGFERDKAFKLATLFYRKKVKDISLVKGIPKKLKELIEPYFNSSPLTPLGSVSSVDGSVKYLFSTQKGLPFETVYLPDQKRSTVCVSSQSGCRMGCPFCVTGRFGFKGNLNAGEIVSQVLSLPYADKITHLVFMGMGEPMDNLDEVLKACEIFTAEWGMAVSPRNITVSTVGITPALKEFLNRSECNLAVSLFSPFSYERERVVPVEKKYPMGEIIDMMKSFPVTKKRRFSLAYIMIKDVNDSDKHLGELIRIVKGSQLRINLLPYHPADDDKYLSSGEERISLFKHSLVTAGISASIRKSRGTDISAACGHLASGLKKSNINRAETT